MSAHTFNCDDVHALHGIEGAEAGVDRAVHQLVILAAGHHDCAGAAAALPAAQLGACQAQLCSGHSTVKDMHSRCRVCAHAVLGKCNRSSGSSSCWLASFNAGVGKPRQGHCHRLNFWPSSQRLTPQPLQQSRLCPASGQNVPFAIHISNGLPSSISWLPHIYPAVGKQSEEPCDCDVRQL